MNTILTLFETYRFPFSFKPIPGRLLTVLISRNRFPSFSSSSLLSFPPFLSSFPQASGEATAADMCYSLQETIFAMLVEITERAMAHTGAKTGKNQVNDEPI